jgi:sugar lactone lactonase YvrE
MKSHSIIKYFGLLALAMGLSQAATIDVGSQSGLYVLGLNSSASQIFSTTLAGAPIGLATDASGNVYAATFAPGAAGNTVQKLTAGGSLLGTYASLPSGISGPFGIAFDSAGNLYVSALSSNVIEKYDTAGNFIGTLANINAPRGLAFDKSGNLWVVSSASGGQLFQITSTTTLNQNPVASAASGLADPRYIAFDASGNLYVDNTTTGTILKYGLSGGTLSAPTTFASGLGGPNGLGFDAAGNLYVADYFDNNVHEFSAAGVDLGVFKANILNANGLAVSNVVTPEPATFAMLGVALGALALRRRKA